MIEALHTAIRNIFPTVPLKYISLCFVIKKCSCLRDSSDHVFRNVIFSYIIRKIEVIPASRLQSIRGSELARSTEATRHTGPCGGFSTQYACMCDLHGVPYREEVAWVRFNDIARICFNNAEIASHKNLIQRDTNFRTSIPYTFHMTPES